MKKIMLILLVSLFCASQAMAVSWYWDLSGTDYLALGPNPPVSDGGDRVNFFNDIGTASVAGTVSTITQDLGGDGILNNGDTFSEFGALAVLDADNLPNLSFVDRSDYPGDSNFRNAYIEFIGLTGSILNYNNGIDGLDTTLANYTTNLVDDSFDLTFDPGVGTIKFYLDDDYDSTNGGNTLEIASLTLLSGEGTSPEFVLGQLEGQFGIIAGFLDVLPGFWHFADGTPFEDFMTQFGIPSIFATSFNLGATLVDISDNGDDLIFEVLNEGSWQITVVPEPSTFLLLGGGLFGLGILGYRRRNQK